MASFYDAFGSGYEQRILDGLKKIYQRQVEEKSCYVCKHSKDISDDRNTCYLCKYTNDFLPKCLTCLLWELKEEKYYES